MIPSDYFTALPSNISALVIAEYLNLADIVRLDTAYCGKDARNQFISLYREDACLLTLKKQSIINFTVPAFLWFASRSLSVQGLSLHKTWNPSVTDRLIAYVKNCGKSIKFFHPALDRGDTMSVVQFKTILKYCPEMAVIVGIPVSFVTKHAMKVVRTSNRKLMSLTVFQEEGSYSSDNLSALTELVEGGLPTLKILRLPLTEDFGNTLEVIAQNCPNLETMEIKDSNAYEVVLENGDGILAALSGCTNLEKVILPARTVTDAGLRALSMCSKLTVLELSDNADVTGEGFEAISKGCPQLAELHLTNIKARQDAPRLHTTQFHNLQKLALRFCQALRDADISHLAATCPKLTDVDLYMCVNLTDISICHLSTGCPSLKQLNMVGVQFTDASFVQLAQTSTQLTHLQCTPYEPFEERVGVLAAFTHLTKLQHLSVERTNLLNDPLVLSTLLENCPQLHTVETMFAEVCQEIMDLMGSANPPFQYCGDGIFER